MSYIIEKRSTLNYQDGKQIWTDSYYSPDTQKNFHSFHISNLFSLFPLEAKVFDEKEEAIEVIFALEKINTQPEFSFRLVDLEGLDKVSI